MFHTCLTDHQHVLPLFAGQTLVVLHAVPGCDTFVALPPAAPQNTVIFGKNSDRPNGKGQSVRRYLGGTFDAGSMLKCTYIEIPQAPKTFSVLLSQIDWMWGAEMGANECGVVIGNEAVWTNEADGPTALLGMDLLRLGLERGESALAALKVITSLLEQHGQGGACAENDRSFTYHNSFLLADPREAWVLETAGACWVAERITNGARNISNGLTIGSNFDLMSEGLLEYAKEKSFWDGRGPFHWAHAFSSGGLDLSPHGRQACGARLMEQHGKGGTLDSQAMMDILRNHPGGICMHGGFETTSAMVSELREGKATHWLTGRPHPCESDQAFHVL